MGREMIECRLPFEEIVDGLISLDCDLLLKSSVVDLLKRERNMALCATKIIKLSHVSCRILI
jgi:hypothetical protein